jgi:DNA-binding transcriptional LysR family regulator
VLEHGSFSRAAEATQLTQSTISFHVKALESAAGARLLDRRGGRVRPTASGVLLRRYAVRLLAARDEALGRLQEQESGQTGHVTIAASTIPAEYLLPKALAQFRTQHPQVSVTVAVSDSRRAVASLVDHACDFALIGAKIRDKRIVSTPFADDEVVLVGRVPSPSISPHRMAEPQIANLPLVVREDGSGTRDAGARFLAWYRSRTERALGLIEVGSTEAARRCALNGVGLALLSRIAVADDVKAGRLAVLTAPGLPSHRRFHAARLRQSTLPAAARALFSGIIQQYR